MAKFDDDAKMKESIAFEMAAVGIFNTIDFVMQNSEDVDKALKNLKIAGNVHKKIPNFQVSYLKVQYEYIQNKLVSMAFQSIAGFTCTFEFWNSNTFLYIIWTVYIASMI